MKYDIKEWYDGFEKDKLTFVLEDYSLKSSSKVLLPGRFYVLEYKAATKEMYNQLPIILSLGLSKKDPTAFLCIDIAYMPKKIREQFIFEYFKQFNDEIFDNMCKYPDVADADKQKQIKGCDYTNMSIIGKRFYIKGAVKKYKIENTFAIHSVPFSFVYKMIGRYADTDTFINGSIKVAQNEFIMKMR